MGRSNEIKLIISDDIAKKIYTIRNCQVMLDKDLAVLYQIETRALKQAVKRNSKRFPDDFMFILNDAEIESLVSQFVIPIVLEDAATSMIVAASFSLRLQQSTHPANAS